jgi:hypothetical protein
MKARQNVEEAFFFGSTKKIFFRLKDFRRDVIKGREKVYLKFMQNLMKIN